MKEYGKIDWQKKKVLKKSCSAEISGCFCLFHTNYRDKLKNTQIKLSVMLGAPIIEIRAFKFWHTRILHVYAEYRG